MDSYELIDLISKSEKKTPVKVYLKGDLEELMTGQHEYYGDEKSGVLFTSHEEWKELLAGKKNAIVQYRLECDRRHSAIPMADLTQYDARIEPGAIIRDHVEIGQGAVIMMGAVINLGATVGEGSMIDMNVVLGGRAQVGKNCHIGAGSVLAGVIEPPSDDPVVVEDNVLIGANVVIAEGVRVGQNSVVAAGAIVLGDVEENAVYAGTPAKKIKEIDDKTKGKTQMVQALRALQ